MKNHPSIYFYGITIIISGIFLLMSKNVEFETNKLSIGIILTVGAFAAFISAFIRIGKQVQFAYHEIHAITMIVYATCLLLFCSNIEALIYYTNFLFIFYSFSEIIFSSWLFNLGQKVVLKILITRILLGLSVGLGTIVAMHYTTYTFTIFGSIFIAIGMNVLLYSPVMRESQINYKFKSMYEGKYF